MEANTRNGDIHLFRVKDCALVRQSTGLKALTLREFRDLLERIPSGSIYHHFWGRFLQPQFDEPEYNNDFAAWSYHGLHEKALAEKLSVIDPTEYEDIEDLRQELIDRVEEYIYENERVTWLRADEEFFFLQSQLVVLDTSLVMNEPNELLDLIPRMSLGSIFYHFIDARKRTPENIDDFSTWLSGFSNQYQPLIMAFRSIDPYFSSLKAIRNRLYEECVRFFKRG